MSVWYAYDIYTERMEKIKKEDVSFIKMVGIIEQKIEEQIRNYNNTKSKKDSLENLGCIKFYIPSFPMTPIQRTALHLYLKEKYKYKFWGDCILVRKCIFPNKYVVRSGFELW